MLPAVVKPIVFVDTVCPKPYDTDTLRSEGMGGTEATVIRVAEELGKTEPVWVMQHKRTASTINSNVVYKPLKPYLLNREFRAQAFVVLRSAEAALNLRKYHPDTPIYLWMHDLCHNHYVPFVGMLGKANIRVIVVSTFHLMNWVQMAKLDTSATKWPSVTVVNNPIADDLYPDETPVDKNKLVFFSSPHKGLNIALNYFQAARRQNPDFKLYVSNPGYIPSGEGVASMEGVVDLGVLSHSQVIKEVRSSLCVFYPNHIFPETFGLVFAEANAVGTPVLTSPIGAAREVLVEQSQMLDTRNMPLTIDTLMKWYKERPRVGPNEDFRLSKVVKRWQTVLLGGKLL